MCQPIREIESRFIGYEITAFGRMMRNQEFFNVSRREKNWHRSNGGSDGDIPLYKREKSILVETAKIKR
jgi:hypothetical protein